jgi:DNA-binding YbaB/EbfC family protein
MKARIPNEYKGGPANMQGMLRQAQRTQEQVAEVQAQLEAKEYEIKAGGGVVTVKINGKKEILALDIAPEIVDPDDIETLSDVIVAGVNEAIKRVEDDAAAEMSKVTGGMGAMMPGLF